MQTQGQGHETTFAQIVAQELGLSPDDVEVVHGDTDRTPFGLGTYGSRSTPVSGAAAVMAARKVRERARLVAAAMLEVSADDLEWADGNWRVRGDPEQALGLAEIAMAAHSSLALPDGVEGHLDASAVYNPPNLTFPFGAYICVTDVDPATGEVKVRRFIAVDDCGVRINPMIVEGQVHRGLADGIGMALMQAIVFDEAGNCLGGSFMDYLLPTSMECPSFELGATVTPSPHHPIGAKGVGESATVGSPAAVVNSVIDALAPFGVVHADMPLTPADVWCAIQGRQCVPTWRSADERVEQCQCRPARQPNRRLSDDGDMSDLAEQLPDVPTLLTALDRVSYLADEPLGTALFLAARMGQPILLEGEPGVGKTEAAKALAAVLDTPLIRLQCYEGLTSAEALYEWNYPRQLLAIRLAEAQGRDAARGRPVQR